MSKCTSTQKMVRRDFIRCAVLGGGALAALPTISAAAVVPAGPDQAPERAARGYRETEHVRKYYETARG